MYNNYIYQHILLECLHCFTYNNTQILLQLYPTNLYTVLYLVYYSLICLLYTLSIFIQVLPLHGSLQSSQQTRVFLPAPAGHWKIVLSTNIGMYIGYSVYVCLSSHMHVWASVYNIRINTVHLNIIYNSIVYIIAIYFFKHAVPCYTLHITI